MPKRKLKKNTSWVAKYNNAAYAQAMDIDAHSFDSDIDRIQERIDYIQDEILKARRKRFQEQNKESFDYENTKRKEEKQRKDLSDILSKNNLLREASLAMNVTGGSTPEQDPTAQATMSAFAHKLGSELGHIINNDIPNMPADYGLTDLFKDQWNSFFGEMNNLQAQDAIGYQTRAANDRKLIQSYNDSLDKLDEIETIDLRLDLLKQIPVQGLTQGLLLNIALETDLLNVRKRQLLKEYDALAEDRKMLEDTVHQSSVGSAWDRLMSGNQILGGDWKINLAGKTTAFHDELNDARSFLYDLGNRSRTETRMLLNRALKEYDRLNEGWNTIIQENQADAEKHKSKVTDWFKARESSTEINLTDPATYLYKMPGILGGSNSSWMKQLPAYAASIVALVGSSGASLPVLLGVLGAGGATNFALNRASGISENNAEVALAAKEKIQERTGMTDKDIEDILSGKITDQAKLRKITDNIRNSENLFRKDMAATTWDAAIESALMTIPVGSMAKFGKFLKGRKAVSKILENPTLNKVVSEKLGADLSAGWKAGNAVSPVVGAATGLTNATIGRFIIDNAPSKLKGVLSSNISKILEALGKTIDYLSPEKIANGKSLINGTRIKYAKGIGGKMIKSAISEGIEEGKQYLNAEEFKNAATNEKLMNTFGVAFSDMISGLTAGAYMLGIPLDGLGLIDLKDEQILLEIKGGMLGGPGHVAAVSVLQSAAPYIREQRAHELVTQQLYADKLASQANFKQYTDWLNRGLLKPGANEVLSSFENLRKINNTYNETNGSYAVEPDLIDQAEKKYKQILSIAADPITRKEAENAGIKVNDSKIPAFWRSNKDYHEFVALKSMAIDAIEEKRQNKKDSDNNVALVEREVDRRLFSDVENEQALEWLNYLQQENDEQRAAQSVAISSAQEQENFLNSTYTKSIARLAALLKYRDLIEQGLELQKDNPAARVRRGLKNQLKAINALIDHWIDVHEDIVHQLNVDVGNGYVLNKNKNLAIRTLNDVENHLVYNQEEHDMLTDAYEEQLKWQMELNSAELTYQDLFGKHLRLKDGKVNDITEEDSDWDAREDINNFTTTKGSAKKTIDSIHKMEKDDDDFETLIETVYKEDLKAEHLSEANGWVNPQIDPNAPVAVNDANGKQVVVQFDENGIPNRRFAEGEFVDRAGRLWETPSMKRRDPLRETMWSIERGSRVDLVERAAFAEAWKKNTDTEMPMTPEGFEERMKSVSVKTAPVTSSATPSPSSEGTSKPPVTPPTPPTPPVTPPVDEDPQQDTINYLKNKYEEDKKLVLKDPNGYHTTSQDYFILVNNVPTRMSRVHNVKPESYIHEEDNTEIDKIYNSLRAANSIDEIREALQKEANPDLQVYIKYLSDNESLFFNNPTLETVKEYDTTIRHIAQSIVNGNRSNSSSIRMGNIVDELDRNFFGTPVLYNQTSTVEGIQLLFNSTNISENRTYADLFGNNFEAFTNYVKQLRNQYEYYTNVLKWKLLTLPFTWRAQFNDLGWVAGETDLIGVDTDGNIHIIDFKTSYRTFHNEYTPNIQLTQSYSSDLNIIQADDFKNGKPNRKVRNVLRNIKNDTKKSNITILWDENLNRAVISDKSRPFLELPNRSIGQVLSSYEDYSNQQTSYARMISLESGNTVASVEILPSRCNYDRQMRVIYGIDMEDRIVLHLSKSMLDILDGVVNKEQQVLDALSDELNTKYNTLKDKLEDLRSKITDDIFNELSDSGKLIFSDYISAVNNIILPDADDIDSLNEALREVEDLLNGYQQMLTDLRQDYVAQRAKEALRVETEQKNNRRNNHRQEDEDQDVTGTQNARNKRDSRGNTSRTNLNYLQVLADRELELATSAPDFITSADFELHLDGDNVLVDITYGGKTWKNIRIDTSYNGTKFTNGIKLIQDIKRLQESKTADQRIVPVRATMTRTRGRIKLAINKDGRVVYQPISNTDLFAGEDIYDIEFSPTYGNVGIIDNSGRAVVFDGLVTKRNVVYTWRRLQDVPARGTLIYVKHLRKDELGKDSLIPVAIDRVKLTDNDVNFILNMLKNPTMLDREYYAEINGLMQNTHATGRQLANLLIDIVDDVSKLTNAVSIYRDPNFPNIIRLVNREDVATNGPGRGTYDINDATQLQRLTDELKSMSVAERHDVLLSRLGDNKNANLPFSGIRKFFVEQNARNNSLKSVKITDTISFDLDDFKTTVAKSGVTRKGVNGFAYYLKHGILRTLYAGMGSCNVEINDVMLENTNTPDVQSTGALETPLNTIQYNPDFEVDSSEIEGFLLKTQSKRSKKVLSKEKAERHIREILGDNVPIEFEDDFLKVASGAAHVIGNCKADGITISALASPRTEYHEAFHRIFEMLVDEKQRDNIYSNVAKRLGLLLYDRNNKENLDAFRTVGEYAADRYEDFMHYRMTDIKIPFFTKAFNKIHDWVYMLTHISDRDLYKIFIKVNRGEYREAMPSKKSVDRFNRLYKELHAQIHGVDFDNIVNRPMYDKLRETVLFCIIQGQNVDRSGRNILEVGKHIDKQTFKAGIDKMLKLGFDIIGQNTEGDLSIGQLAMKEIYEKFDNESLRDDIANYISAISTDYVKTREEESNEDAQGDEESVANASIGEHTRASYEFSRFEKTSSRVRFFFATIPDTIYGNPVETMVNGKKVIRRPQQLATNEFGLPQFVPVNVVFNEFLNYFHDVDTINELFDNLQLLAKDDPMYETLYLALNKIYKTMYQVKDEKIVKNPDQEALMSQIMNIIRSNKHNFDIAKSNLINGENGKYRIIIQPSDTDYNASFYPTQWNQMLVNGGTPIIKIATDGSLQFNPKIKNSHLAFEMMSKLFDHSANLEKAENGAIYQDVGIKQWLDNINSTDSNPVYLKVRHNGTYAYLNNPNDNGQIEIVKNKIVESLNLIGINVNAEEFNYMLRHKYGSTDAKALSMMFNSTAREDSMTSFLQFLKDISKNGQIVNKFRIGGKQVDIQNAYKQMAFVKDLANWKYQYRHAHDQLTVLATNNNKFYEISDNNYISDVVRALNKHSDEFDEIKSDVYNYFEDTENIDVFGNNEIYGSLILEDLTRNPNKTITVRNFIGFKTDKRNDYGSDYFLISKREDYVAKAAILERGDIIMPTLSDKKTWVYLTGVKLPGLDYENSIDQNGNPVPLNVIGDQFVISKDPISLIENMLSLDEQVILRFISYAMSEYQSIKKADADLDLMEADGTKSSDVANYYTKEQGAKFSSLLGVWEYDYKKDDAGNMVISGETFHSFNDNSKTRKQNIAEAEKYFFNRDRETQERLIQRLLHKQFLREVDTCEELGLIKKIGNSDNIFENYENVGLNADAISSIYKSIVSKNGNPQDVIGINKYKSLAVMIYINDISNKAIMSGQEVERVFSGNPSFYKWKYDDNGNLIDRTVDELKRLGGLISTGNNNFLELLDIPAKYLDADGKFTGKYKCAQVSNELIESPQYSILKEQIEYGELATAAYIQEERKTLAEFRRLLKNGEFEEDLNIEEEEYKIRRSVSDRLDKMSSEELRSLLDANTLAIVDRKIKEVSDSYKLKYKNGKVDDGIDVADGAAYITDTMAEMLLRMNGNYSAAIEKAFKILREETKSTILEKQQAYQDVVTSVIGSQKYTAFGRRKHPKTGVLITYYNKMALFPMFQCISTGRMLNIFNKMKQQGIDMLMVDSAVKVGSQGSKDVNWDSFMHSSDETDPTNHVDNNVNNPLKPAFDESFEFDTYELKFEYLRKQLNTDPKEDYLMSMGTQMTKIIMSALFDGRDYTTQDDRVLSGKEIRNDIMNCINELSNRGLKNIAQRFFKTNKQGELVDADGNIISYDSDRKVLDEVKFSKEVRSLLNTKDPDKNVLDAIELVDQKDDDGVVRKHMRLPLNAISNSNWLESILISAINKKVVDIETPGAAFIQRSVWGMEQRAMYERKNGNILSDENLSPTINNGERLLMVNEEGSMDCVVSLDFIKKMFDGELPKVPIKDKNRKVIWDLIPEKDDKGQIKKDNKGKIIYALKKDKNGKPMVDDKGNPVYKRKIRTREMTPDELKKWLINRKIIGKEATATIIGYRIPTQAVSSIHALRIVDILPVVNDTIILPAEFTKITGSDFDIDKLFLSSIRYKVQREADEEGNYHLIISDVFDEKENAYYQNRLIKDYMALLLDWKSKDDKTSRSTNLLHRSIDNDTKLLTNIIEDVEKNIESVKEEPYEFYSLSTQTESKNDYITGKIGIGPFALNNNSHILTMMYHVKFKHIESSIMSELGLENLDSRVDKNGESIMSWLSALINAHVDIAKDPYISRLNVGPFTYNLVNLLVRTGLGDKTFYFTLQPIMRVLAKAYVNAGSMYMADPYSSKYTLQKEAIEAVEKEWFENSGITFEGHSAMLLIKAIKDGGNLNADIRSKVNKKIAKLFDNNLKLDAKSNTLNLENQLFYYLAYLLFDKYANSLSNLVKYSKIDTKKHGKSVMEQHVYRQGYDMTYNINRDSNLFESVGLYNMMNDSYIDTKTRNAIDSVRDILGSLFILSTPAFLNTVDSILNAIGRTESLQASLVTKVANAVSAAVKSKFFVDEYVPSITNNPNYMHDLVSESREVIDFSIQTQGNSIKLNLNSNHSLSSYVGGTAEIYYYGTDGKTHSVSSTITGFDELNNTVTIYHTLPAMYGKVVLKGGKNTIYDRLLRLQTLIQSDPTYSNLLDQSGGINNRLLEMLVPGRDAEYQGAYIQGERPDTYETMKFVKFFNFVEDSGSTANYLIDAWDDLLNYTNDNKEAQLLVRDFARDLIVYGFITSGDRGGFTKIFKYVPASWRESSGYGNFIKNKLIEYSIGNDTDIDVQDVILNNWFDNDFVRTYKLKDKNKIPQFITYTTKINGFPQGFPTVLAAIKKEDGQYKASIDPNNAPMYIKIARRKDKNSYDSQRRFTIYKLHNIALSANNVEYPVYVKVDPKGNQVGGGFLITEYGRSDRLTPQEYEVNEDTLRKVYQASNVAEHINLVKNAEPNYAAIISGLNRYWQESEERSILSDEASLNDDTTVSQGGEFFDNNTMLNIYQNWEYMEESGNSTPRSDIKSIKHIAKSVLGTEIDESVGNRMYDFVSKLNEDSETNSRTVVPYSEYKDVVSKISRFDDIRQMLMEEVGLTELDVYGKYNKQNRTLSLSRYVYDLYKLISQNQDLLLFMNNVLNDSNMFHYIVTDEDSILYMLDNGLDIFDDIETQVENYSQLDLFQDTVRFDDSEFSDEAMKHCKS